MGGAGVGRVRDVNWLCIVYQVRELVPYTTKRTQERGMGSGQGKGILDWELAESL